jgi:ABC-type glycerol-3-phosphate transport system substrate-binding protein
MGATGVVMAATTRVAREAFRVWEWYVGGERAEERPRSGWGIPPLLSLRRLMPEATPWDRARKAIALDDARYFTVWQASPFVTWTPFAAAWTRHIDALVRGAVTPDRFVDLVFAAINADLAAGRAELGE